MGNQMRKRHLIARSIPLSSPHLLSTPSTPSVPSLSYDVNFKEGQDDPRKEKEEEEEKEEKEKEEEKEEEEESRQ